jgi:MFS family permease
VAFTAIFVLIERRSTEPILAPHLFRNRVFTSASAIGFVVGFAMFGALTFLPYYFQMVRGVSPTSSGLRLLPMMAGLFGASIITGQLVAKGWRYRPFPMMGTAVMTIGLGLLGTIGLHTSSFDLGIYMLVLGIGLGLVMQILVTAVQNAVDPADIGVGTAGANFFRSIGGSFGTAIFGALFAHEVPQQLAAALKGRVIKAGSVSPTQWTPKLLHKLPPTELAMVLHVLDSSIQFVYRWAIPVGALAFLLSLTLPEIKLRTSLHPISDEIPMSTDGNIL